MKLQNDEKRKKVSRPSLFKRLFPTTSTKQSSAKTTGDDPEISDISGEKDAPDIENNSDKIIKTTPTASPDETNIDIDPNESESPNVENDRDTMIKSTPTASPDDEKNTNIDHNRSEVPSIGIDQDKNIESSLRRHLMIQL